MSTNKPIKFISLSWSQLQADTIALAKKIKQANIKLDEIVSISRGGMVVARMLSDLLSLPISHIAIESYEDLKQGKEPILTQVSPRQFKGEVILLVDELSDSGKTFVKGIEYMNSLPVGGVYSVAPYIKPHTKYLPDFYVKSLDGWLIFPYELAETKKAFTKEFGSEEKALKRMKELGVKDWES